MGKAQKKTLEQQHHQDQQQPNSSSSSSSSSSASSSASSGLICPECSRFFFNHLTFRCVFVLILALAAFLSGLFWILPRHSLNSGFDAKQAFKLGASVQAYFRLDKPVRDLVPHIPQLEYDINGEIGVPDTKVAILSMHQYGPSNWTDVVFGILADPMDAPLLPVSISVLKSSLVELFLKQFNLTMTSPTFGQPYMFEIVKCPGGITVNPGQVPSIWQIPLMFNFTLNNSITEIVDNFGELKEQLRVGLHLMSYEGVSLQVTNLLGSTIDSPVEVQASLVSTYGGLLPQRMKQLAQIITGSPARNLGLDNAVFGKVKSIRLSSFLKGTLYATPPTPSPAPSPDLSDNAVPSISPTPAPTVYPATPSPSKVGHPPRLCLYRGPTVPPSSSPNPHSNPNLPTTYAPSMNPSSQVARHVSPAPVMSYTSGPGYKSGNKGSWSPSAAPTPSSFAVGTLYIEIRLLGLFGLIFLLLCC